MSYCQAMVCELNLNYFAATKVPNHNVNQITLSIESNPSKQYEHIFLKHHHEEFMIRNPRIISKTSTMNKKACEDP